MSITITIDTDSAAFEKPDRGFAVASILRQLATAMEKRDASWPARTWSLRDANGNTCGEVVVGPDEEA